ncbi:MAG: hypothetical protein ABIJ39_06080 [Chloroflexota bacterium]
MHSLLAIALVLLAFLAPGGQTQADAPVIFAPQTGQSLQGSVPVVGTSQLDGFVSAEIAFAYADNPAGSWFLIAASSQPVVEASLAVWDTTAITDGVYTLRLRVFLEDGSFQEAFVADVRVRNYTPTETPTPTITPRILTPVPSVTPTATPPFTPTALPPNPVEISTADVWRNAAIGGLGIVVFLALGGIYLRLRRGALRR